MTDQKPREYKSFHIPAGAVKILDDEQGIVEHIITVFGVPDKGMPPDVSHPGSFKKTIAERGLQVLVLDQHRADSVMRVLGKPVGIQEVGREGLPSEILDEYPEATGGVQATTQFFLDTPEGLGTFRRIKNGGITEWSYGYDPLDVKRDKIKWRGEDLAVRHLKTVKLYEYSPVLWGMAESATLDAKAAATEDDDAPSEGAEAREDNEGKGAEANAVGPPETKAVVPFQDLPLADRQRSWDGTAAEQRVREWAGPRADMDWQKYRTAFMWYNADSPELFGSYKLPYADIIDGSLTAVPRAIFTIANPQRGVDATDIPDTEKERIKQGQVSRYYAKMKEEFEDESIIPPWDKVADKSDNQPGDDGKEHTGRGPVKRMGDYLEGCIHYVFTTTCDKWFINGMISREERLLLSSLIGDALDLLHEGMPYDMADREISHDYYGYYDMMAAALEDMQTKAGRVLSTRNTERLQRALAEIHEILMSAGMVENGNGAGNDDDVDEEDDKVKQQQRAGAGPDEPPTPSGEAGPDEPPTSDEAMLQLIDLEREQLALLEIA